MASSRLQSPAQRRARRERRLGLGLIAAALVLVALVAALRWRAAARLVALDPVSLCPTQGGPRGYAAVLVDVTDAPNPVQRAALRKEVLDVERQIPAHHRVRIFVLQPDAASELPEPVFDRCKPPPPSEDAAGWTHNPALERQRWQEQYLRPFEAALDSATRSEPGTISPVMEWIQAAAVTAFPGHADPAPRRLVIVSDFLQHAPEHSHYRGAPRFEEFERSPYARKVHADLSRFEVRALYLRRDGQEPVQSAAHREFWERFFVWSGVREDRLDWIPIEG